MAWALTVVQRRTEVASKVHRQNTLDQLRKFNAKRKLKVQQSRCMATAHPLVRVVFVQS